MGIRKFGIHCRSKIVSFKLFDKNKKIVERDRQLLFVKNYAPPKKVPLFLILNTLEFKTNNRFLGSKYNGKENECDMQLIKYVVINKDTSWFLVT